MNKTTELTAIRDALSKCGITGDSLFARIREDIERGLIREARSHLNFVDGINAAHRGTPVVGRKWRRAMSTDRESDEKSWSMADIKDHADMAAPWPGSGVLNWGEIGWGAMAAWVTLSVEIGGDATLPEYDVESVKSMFEEWWRSANAGGQHER